MTAKLACARFAFATLLGPFLIVRGMGPFGNWAYDKWVTAYALLGTIVYGLLMWLIIYATLGTGPFEVAI